MGPGRPTGPKRLPQRPLASGAFYGLSEDPQRRRAFKHPPGQAASRCPMPRTTERTDGGRQPSRAPPSSRRAAEIRKVIAEDSVGTRWFVIPRVPSLSSWQHCPVSSGVAGLPENPHSTAAPCFRRPLPSEFSHGPALALVPAAAWSLRRRLTCKRPIGTLSAGPGPAGRAAAACVLVHSSHSNHTRTR